MEDKKSDGLGSLPIKAFSGEEIKALPSLEKEEKNQGRNIGFQKSKTEHGVSAEFSKEIGSCISKHMIEFNLLSKGTIQFNITFSMGEKKIFIESQSTDFRYDPNKGLEQFI